MDNVTVAHPATIEADPFGGDVCAWAARRMEEAALGIRERRTEEELVEALIEEEERLGRAMSGGEVRGFALGFFSPTYTMSTFAEDLARARVVGAGLPIKDDAA